MQSIKYLILGAGPAGLAFANRILEKGETSFLVIEKEAMPGGLCRSEEVDGAPLDIGGGHFLDVRDQRVNEFLFQFMPEDEWNHFERDSKIFVHDQYIGHPFEANIWQFDIDRQVEYLKSIAEAGCVHDQDMPTVFTDWITWKLGEKIANDYMLPYNRKMFSKDLNALGTYWLEKLPNVSFEETLRSCLEHKAYGKQPGHAKFYYPKKYGYGELWRRMGEHLGEHLLLNCDVNGLRFENDKTVVSCKDGQEYMAETVILTIPWDDIGTSDAVPEDIRRDISNLKHNSVQIDYHSEKLDTKAHWIYYPSEELDYHRILVRHNFALGSKGYWTETNSERISDDMHSEYSYLNEYAYPLNTIDKPQIMERILEWGKTHHIYGLGRWGEHSHFNSDVTVGRAMDLADRLLR